MAPDERSGTLAAIVAVLIACFLSMLSGCGTAPQLAGEDRELIVSLATAISARNADWLTSNEQLIEHRKAEGGLSEDAHRELMAVVADARAGRWAEAERAITAIREGQEPTAEDFKAVAERQLDYAGRKLVGERGRKPPS